MYKGTFLVIRKCVQYSTFKQLIEELAHYLFVSKSKNSISLIKLV